MRGEQRVRRDPVCRAMVGAKGPTVQYAVDAVRAPDAVVFMHGPRNDGIALGLQLIPFFASNRLTRGTDYEALRGLVPPLCGTLDGSVPRARVAMSAFNFASLRGARLHAFG